MARKDLAHSIAETFLIGTGLDVSKRIVESLLADAMKAGDADRAESLGKIRGDLRKLSEKEAGA